MTQPLIYKQLSLILRDCDAIGKDRVNEQQKFRFRGIDDIMNGLHAIFARHEVFLTSKVLETKEEARQNKSGGNNYYFTAKYEFTFWAVDGSSVSTEVVGQAMDNADKAANKSISIALKYALTQMLLIPTEEEKDPDYKGYDEKIDEAQTKKRSEEILANLGAVWKAATTISTKEQVFELLAKHFGRKINGSADLNDEERLATIEILKKHCEGIK